MGCYKTVKGNITKLLNAALSWLVWLRDRSLFFKEGGGVGNFQKCSAQKNCWKIKSSKRTWTKETKPRAGALYYPGSVFDVKKILAQATARQKKHKHIKVRRKISYHRKVPSPTRTTNFLVLLFSLYVILSFSVKPTKIS